MAHRGGEAVLELIASLVVTEHQPAGLYTMFLSPRFASGLKPASALSTFLSGSPRVSRLSRLPDRLRRWTLPLYPRAVSELSSRLAADHQSHPIDLLISTSSAAIKGLRPPPGVPHICYCHTPARYLWTQAEQYALGRGGRLRAAGLSAFGRSLRRWDHRTAANVTRFLANSSHTQGEIRRCYERESTILFPPVRTNFFTPSSTLPREDFWLYVGALEPYKRVDLAIAAANRARHTLVIAGDGSQGRHLRGLAGPTVRFVGRVDDADLLSLYRRAKAVIFPQVEDFGIVAAEAQACGTPVLALRGGGALDSVVEGTTGAFFDEPSAESLLAAASALPAGSGVAEACRQNALRFSEDSFVVSMRNIISASRRSA